jgi:orotate phosphoribosyltransferase
MPDLSSSALIELVSGRRGHFAMESGYHSALWLDLDALFAAPERVRPFVEALADALRRHNVDVVCGPLTGGAFLAQRLAESLGIEFWYTVPAAPEEGTGLFRARYTLPPALARRASQRRLAIVDDVMSAGSSLRATYAELQAHGAEVVAVGALLVLGDVGAAHFGELGVPVEAVARDEFRMWPPAECPDCAAGIPVERVSGAGA